VQGGVRNAWQFARVNRGQYRFGRLMDGMKRGVQSRVEGRARLRRDAMAMDVSIVLPAHANKANGLSVAHFFLPPFPVVLWAIELARVCKLALLVSR
jgi:hypothetical protein